MGETGVDEERVASEGRSRLVLDPPHGEAPGGANYAVVGAWDARSRRWRLDAALSRGNHP